VLGENGYHTVYEDASDEFANDCIYGREGTIATLQRIGSYNYKDDAVPASEALGGDTLATSYAYASKPSWFGNLPWPPCDPTNPTQSNDPENYPAGYRAINGEDPPSESAAVSSVRGGGSISGGGGIIG
jgi:hypothetical protein